MKRMILSLGICMWMGAGTVLADEDEADRNFRRDFLSAPGYPEYKKECGSCHMAYPPGLLSGDAWQEIMAGLGRHFGDNAELEEKRRQKLTAYLVRYASDRQKSRHHRQEPTRITQLRWFRHEHDEIPERLVKGNDKVRSLSNCNACHRRAEQATFPEREISIPGHGRWDD
ncbi:MAG: diheme cytochrome c [Gammaproteobacteria bacterium]|nr:diheme cytochrome c [Gammaproteobacteria bacterium]MDH5650637.1 diheme cytochrome c [Gammaproteobacteria bacterium]